MKQQHFTRSSAQTIASSLQLQSLTRHLKPPTQQLWHHLQHYFTFKFKLPSWD